ncbi:MAG TPA: GNAT family N-acetyltransferase [Telluria sp.]|nr:GNAT family N-acetyltransferase [Telluria sp.]
MNPFSIRTLQPEDKPELLRFEQNNREWFERHVDPRGHAFYTADGVHEHVTQYLAAYAQSTWHPCVVVDQSGAIVGRANLKDIDLAAGSAEVGYRMAQHCVGRGLATLAVRHLVELARSHWKLHRLVAYVSDKNVASASVLAKCGFGRANHTETNSAGRSAPPFVLDLR